MTKLTITI